MKRPPPTPDVQPKTMTTMSVGPDQALAMMHDCQLTWEQVRQLRR